MAVSRAGSTVIKTNSKTQYKNSPGKKSERARPIRFVLPDPAGSAPVFFIVLTDREPGKGYIEKKVIKSPVI